MQDCFSKGKDVKTIFKKAGNWRCLIAQWSVLSVGPGFVKLLEPVLEMASNLNDFYGQKRHIIV